MALPAFVPGNARGQVTKSPKLHLVDSGLAAHLAGRDSVAALNRDPAFAGALVETMVANDLRVQAECHDDPVRMYHYREDDHEVDLVLESIDGRIVGIEVKLSSDPGADALRGLRRLRLSSGDRFAGGIVLARVPVRANSTGSSSPRSKPSGTWHDDQEGATQMGAVTTRCSGREGEAPGPRPGRACSSFQTVGVGERCSSRSALSSAEPGRMRITVRSGPTSRTRATADSAS
jgi:hypothetical protein